MNDLSLVSFRAITKVFGGTQALSDVSLELRPGEILALLGENGAGKSTLIKTLAGIHKPDSGEILFCGEPYVHRPPKPLQRQPVAFIHQDMGLIEWMTVGENVGLAQGFSSRAGLIDWSSTDDRAAEALKLVGCDFDPQTRISNLTRTEKALVAIARALATDADVLVLDEPTASLPADEVERLFDAIRPLKDRGVGMIYVSHRLDEIFRIADRVAVLRDGKLVGETAVTDTTPSELVELIVGRKTDELFVKGSVEQESVSQASQIFAALASARFQWISIKANFLGLSACAVLVRKPLGARFSGRWNFPAKSRSTVKRRTFPHRDLPCARGRLDCP
nr:ATP-binding cassette domain-containing protein [Marinicella sp. W31]MDC2875490.1 ATP-binding cassette domain-containing protein [Marinicella sp. W31]